MTRLVLVLALVAILAGCGSPGDQYQASSIAFVAAVDAASELRAADKLPEPVIEIIDAAVDQGQEALSKWAQALRDGEDYPEAKEILAAVVARIRRHMRLQKE